MTNPNDTSRRLFERMNDWATASPRGCRSGGDSAEANFSFTQLHHRPDTTGPERQLTFRAVVVDGRPVVHVDEFEPARAPSEPHHEPCDTQAGSRHVVLSGTALPAREPDQSCEACGTAGTIGRAVRTDGRGNVLEIHRFCLQCWPEQSARYRARWEEVTRQASDAWLRAAVSGKPDSVPRPEARAMAFEAATWHALRDVVRQSERALAPPVAPNPADLALLAAEIRRCAPEMEGEMPFEVEMFVRKYGTSPG